LKLDIFYQRRILITGNLEKGDKRMIKKIFAFSGVVASVYIASWMLVVLVKLTIYGFPGWHVFLFANPEDAVMVLIFSVSASIFIWIRRQKSTPHTEQ